MNNGNVNNNNKGNNNYVWPVRAGEWTPRVPDGSCANRPSTRPSLTEGVSALFADLYKSWKTCRRLKRGSINALRFEYRAELHLLELAEELADGTYKPSRVIRFAVDKPKLREIVAADFRDRVVHHYLVERLEKIYEPIFIHDNYACRKDKGVHKALERVRQFMRQWTQNNTTPLYALHLDVKSYFVSIDRRILLQLIEDRLVKEARKPDPPHSSLDRGETTVHQGGAPSLSREGRGGLRGRGLPLSFLYRLTRTILEHNPLERRIDKGNPTLLAAVSPHKSLLHAPPGKGLPVGNLTSQFFANVYLNELDQFCKHTLKCRYYLRYCDDFLILDADPRRLERLREEIGRFLQQRLRLELNTRYAAITDVRKGIDFIGYIIRPEYVLVRRRSVNNLKTRLLRLERTGVLRDAEGLYSFRRADRRWLEQVRSVTASYYGHFKWANTIRLRRGLFMHYPWLNTVMQLDAAAMPRLRKQRVAAIGNNSTSAQGR